MTRATILQKVEQAPERALALVEAVLEAAGRGETPEPWDPAWAEAVRAMDRAAAALRNHDQRDLAAALDRIVDRLTTIFPVVELADDLTPKEHSAIAEARDEYERGELISHEEVKRELGLA